MSIKELSISFLLNSNTHPHLTHLCLYMAMPYSVPCDITFFIINYFTNSNSYATTHGFDAHVPFPETLSISEAKASRGVSFKMSPTTKWVGCIGKFFGKFGVNCLIPSRKHSLSEISCNRSHLIPVMRIWWGIKSALTNILLSHPAPSGIGLVLSKIL